uniref:Neuroglian n=2 Tax=Cacopsylla melanoneura TaxID=428564 RepID=A0A8D8XH54_9HEMI
MLGSLSLCFLAISVASSNALVQSPPRIVKQPPSSEELLFQVVTQQNENDRPFVIECEAEAEPAPKYRWTKNGKPFDWQAYDDRISQQPGRGTLVISSPRDEDFGQYQCFAENEWGTATSNSVLVRKAELNSFKDEPPQTVSANEGEPFKLTCQPPDGWPKPSVYWLIQDVAGSIKSINNSRMTIDPEGNLWFSNVTRQDASDDFYYVCSATAMYRNEYKIGNRILLNVIATGVSASQNRHAPKQQYATRKNEVALRNKKVELFCIFGGTPLPQTIWYKNGQAINPSDRISQGNYGKSLIIKHVDFDDQGKYTCDVSNGVGEARSYSIDVNVMAAPYFTVEPEIYNKAEEETVTFRCEAEGLPKPEIKWVHNGKPINQAPPNPRRKVGPNYITIENLSKTDTGNYGCNATNSLGYVYKDVYVNVLAHAPEITEQPKDEFTVDGRSVVLTCRVFGAPKPEVKWVHNQVEVTGGRYTILETGDLQIADVQFGDAGEYTCFASNKLGHADASGSLTVKEHTRITDEPEDYEVPAGTSATFRCNAVSDPSLKLTIEWRRGTEVIDFESEPRFVQSNDYSLTVTKTSELDSGVYTCRAKTDLDFTEAQATLTVQDVPNSPRLQKVQCNKRDASIQWSPMGDNRAPILRYTIEYNTSFTPDTWETAFDAVPATDMTYTVPMSPWANFTFRVIAWNKIGKSLPSGHSTVCTTLPDVPFKNPDNVEGRGSTPNNLVISWTAMPEIEHNAPHFMYRVFWKRDNTGEDWNTDDVSDWRRSEIILPNQPTFQPYRIKVVAINEKGEANVSPKEIRGFSGEDVPLEAPSNFTLGTVIDAKKAVLSWNPVSNSSLRGHFRGYKIQTWTEKDGEASIREVLIKSDATTALVDKFVPASKNFARVLAYNGAYNGPPSETIAFVTPEGVPGTVQSLEAIPLGASAFYLKWVKPEQPNGVLQGYKIKYQSVKGTKVGPLLERLPYLTDPSRTTAKLAGLEPATKYRIHIAGYTKAGDGADYFIEQKTRGTDTLPPGKPNFKLVNSGSENGYGAFKVLWEPNAEHPGSHFFVKYRIKGETMYRESAPEVNEDFTIIRALRPSETYEFRVVSVDGENLTESDTQDIDISSDGVSVMPYDTVATAGWFIGMLLAIAFLIVVLILVCLIKRNRGGKYAVHEREAAHGRHDYPEEPGFNEYSQPLDGKPRTRSSMSSEKHPVESDTDSMAEYGDGDTEGMNEDGSFIGLYGKKRGETASGGFATTV